MELGGLWWSNILNSALPPQRHRTDSRPEHQDPVSQTAIMATGQLEAGRRARAHTHTGAQLHLTRVALQVKSSRKPLPRATTDFFILIFVLRLY